MHLARVLVKNFRNLRSLDLSFQDGLNVIVGENNIGKTNLLDSVRAALGAASALEPVRLSRDDRHRAPDGTWHNPIRFDLHFGALSKDEQAEFIDLLNYNPLDPSGSTASLHYEWSWSDTTQRWTSRRWGGERPQSEASIGDDVLQSIPVTLLTALRDALNALAPGRRSRLGQLLRASASPAHRTRLETLIRRTNLLLERHELITSAEVHIGAMLADASGPLLSQTPAIRASEPEFERIVSNLRLMLKEAGVSGADSALSELRANGLGYNNLLYIGTVLAELAASTERTLPLLLVEEPEAHLHPQLQTLLADFLSKGVTGRRVQTLVTTHSPTLAAHVAPDTIRVLHRKKGGATSATAIGDCGLLPRELKQLRRMLDVTKASLLFARGVVFVEGISEALLLPAVGRALGFPIEQAGISVIPVSGVDFSTFAKLFGDGRLTAPVAIITDGDPPLDDKTNQPSAGPDGKYLVGARCAALVKAFAGNPVVRVFASDVTLEHDIARAGPANPLLLFDAWKSCYDREPKVLTRSALEGAGSTNAQALLLWRALCLGQALTDIIARRFSTILVDEFQDTGWFLGRAVIALLRSPAICGLVVGDVDQAIYGFGGANSSLFTDALALDGALPFQISTSQRCATRIARVASSLSRSGAVVKPRPDAEDGRAVLLVHTASDISMSSALRAQINVLLGASIDVALLTRKRSWARRLASNAVQECPSDFQSVRRLDEAVRQLIAGNAAMGARLVASELGSLLYGNSSVTMVDLESAGVEPTTWRRVIHTILMRLAQAPAGQTWAEWIDDAKAAIADGSLAIKGTVDKTKISARLKKSGTSMQKPRCLPVTPPSNDSWQVGTIHGAKGREFESVVVFCPKPGGKYKASCPSVDWWAPSVTSEEREVAFVAASRARRVLVLCVHEQTLASLTASRPHFLDQFDILQAQTS